MHGLVNGLTTPVCWAALAAGLFILARRAWRSRGVQGAVRRHPAKGDQPLPTHDSVRLRRGEQRAFAAITGSYEAGSGGCAATDNDQGEL
jgi:hypothetical protein